MDDINSQLFQMRTLLEHACDDDKPGIQLIINQLEELLGAYSSKEENNIIPPPNDNPPQNSGSDPEEDEYKLFQAEIAALSSGDTSGEGEAANDAHRHSLQNEMGGDDVTQSPSAQAVSSATDSIGNELEALIGMKCMAPHQENWGQIGYHSAMVSSVLSLEKEEDEDAPNDLSSIMVRVIFLQPVVKSQLFCPFYKEDRCKFSDNDCKFSHGEVVPLSQLKEYTEPDYSTIIPGSRVLAKYHDELWYKATVHRITEEGECEISYDVGNEAAVIPLHETTPLNENTSDSDLSEEDDIDNPQLSSESEDETPKTLLGSDALLDIRGNSALGVWEKHTKGIGSKLMMKMGYIMGTGLGKHKEGRVEPVDAIVLPPGKSLDACMDLKEKAKDGNLFSAEKRRLKLERKAAKQRAKQEAQKPKQESNVFEFLNSKLTLRKTTNAQNLQKDTAELRKQSTSNLNKRLFGLNENLRQVNKDIAKTKESMKRHKDRDKETYCLMEKKLTALESQRRELDSLQNSITKEQKIRSDKRKLDLF